MWCLVNRVLGIVIFFYEDTTDENGVKPEGGRGRNVLLDFLGDAKIKSLQSNGYNVYIYLDGELMDIEHLCCMDHFWAKAKKALNQNCAAEQAIRPQTVQRKNSLFYCSTKGAVNSAIYNTFIETCKQAGISFREYFRRVILELKHGRTDYANLLPMTIGLKRY